MSVFLMDCPHCPATSATFDLRWWKWADGLWRICAECGACGDVVIARFSGPQGINLSAIAGNITRHPSIGFVQSFPMRTKPEAPPFTPDAAASRFTDGEFNFQNGRWNAAVGMYRAALDLATKALNAEGATFYARLQWLAANGRVTQEVREWGDHVRIEGNGALHDPEEFDGDDTKGLRFFTEMFLRYVFEMPGEVRRFREQTDLKKTV